MASGAKSILLVDDSRKQARLMQELLRDAAPESRFYALESGEQAVEHLARSVAGEVPVVDLVLLDRDMPRFDGFQTLEKIRALPSLLTLPVLMVTGSEDPVHIDRARQLGASDYLVKPADVDRWEAWILNIAQWGPEAARWGTAEIVRVSCGPGAELVRRVDIAAVGMMTVRPADQKLIEFTAACDFAGITVGRCMNLRQTDKVLDAKRRLVVRWLLSVPQPLPWGELEVRDFLDFSPRYFQERRAENADEPLRVCGSRALLTR